MIDINFNVEEVLQERLAASLGLDRYKFIMDKVNVVNISTDEDFQRTFNGFYLVRRNSEWRKIYYNKENDIWRKEVSEPRCGVYYYNLYYEYWVSLVLVNGNGDVIEWYDPKLLQLLMQTVYDMHQAGRCYVKYERKQSCLHITVR